MANFCKRYVGVACVDGTCPIANKDEYDYCCIDVPKDCKDCWLYNGCEDCFFGGTDYCEIGQPEDQQPEDQQSDEQD